MHLFVSDLHLTDRGVGGAVPDEDLLEITNVLSQASEPLTLVLLGDIVDLLRSTRWDDLYHSGRGPWNDARPGFRHFVASPVHGCALEVVRAALNRYPQFREALQRLVQDRKLRVLYVP